MRVLSTPSSSSYNAFPSSLLQNTSSNPNAFTAYGSGGATSTLLGQAMSQQAAANPPSLGASLLAAALSGTSSSVSDGAATSTSGSVGYTNFVNMSNAAPV
jgi:hypothetical protein